MAEGMIERGLAAYWPIDESITGPLTNGERMRRALLAALDPEDETLVEAIARKIWDDDESADHGFWRGKVIQTIVALHDHIGQGERSSQEQVREKE